MPEDLSNMCCDVNMCVLRSSHGLSTFCRPDNQVAGQRKSIISWGLVWSEGFEKKPKANRGVFPGQVFCICM